MSEVLLDVNATQSLKIRCLNSVRTQQYFHFRTT